MMKKVNKATYKTLFLLILLFFGSYSIFAQTDGISYQAVIIDPNAKELPGVDKDGNILPNATISIRFTIFDATDAEEFTETQITNTDQYGMINLIIGSVNHEEFTRISWDGTPKDLKVEIDFSGSGSAFLDLSRQELLFAPYAYHRNITATGTLKVDDDTNLNGELVVEGPTNLNSSLDVNNANITNLTGPLNVDGGSTLNSTLLVLGATDLNDSLNVNLSPSHFIGTITVEDTATFNGPALFNAPVNFVEITVNGPSHLLGQVNVTANMDTVGDQTNINAYPLLVQGSKQGIAIQVNESRSTSNNYVSFWDGDGVMWGRIEGQTDAELDVDQDYLFEIESREVDRDIAIAETVIAGLETAQAAADLVGASTSSTVCAGLGACVTAPVPSLIVAATLNLALNISNAVTAGVNLGYIVDNLAKFKSIQHENIGVSYQSGAGDYAEWLPKADTNEKFVAGEIVGVRNGYITKNTSGAEKVMVISTNPILLGNMPQKFNEKDFEKIAFMGQVPVRVVGAVVPGDYILPSLFVEGFGRAVNPDDMKITDYKKIVGVAWSVTKDKAYNVVNVAVGLNTNDLTSVIQLQQEKLNMLQNQIEQSNSILSKLVPGYKEALGQEALSNETKDYKTNQEKEEKHVENVYHKGDFLESSEDDIVYIIPSREQLFEGLEQAKALYLQSGKSIDEHPFWKRMRDDPSYKEEILQYMESKFDKAMHTHMSVNKKLTK